MTREEKIKKLTEYHNKNFKFDQIRIKIKVQASILEGKITLGGICFYKEKFLNAGVVDIFELDDYKNIDFLIIDFVTKIYKDQFEFFQNQIESINKPEYV